MCEAPSQKSFGLSMAWETSRLSDHSVPPPLSRSARRDRRQRRFASKIPFFAGLADIHDIPSKLCCNFPDLS